MALVVNRRFPRLPAKQLALVAAFAAMCAIVGGGVAQVFSTSLPLALVAGVAIGSLPAWLPLLRPGWAVSRCAEVVSFTLLIVIAVVVSAHGLLPALADAPVDLEAALPLLLMAPALYGTYLVLNRSTSATSQASVPDRLAAALGGPPLVLTLALAVVVATCAVLLIRYVGLVHESWQSIAAKFVERGIIPPLTLVLFFWGLLLLANKCWVLWRERRLLARSDGRGESALHSAHAQQLVASEVGDTDDFLQLMWRKSADFYVVPRYINWAIPILGFIGTVLGISLAAAGIQNIIGSRGGLADLSTELGQAIAPLGIAFDTTLIALSLSVFLMLLQTALQRWEDDILAEYESYVRSAARREG